MFESGASEELDESGESDESDESGDAKPLLERLQALEVTK